MPKDYLDKIRAKYPEYADIPDTTLAQKIVAKYPEYQDVLGDMTHAPAASAPTPAAQSDQSTYGSRVSQAVHAPGQKLNEAIGQFASGNPIAGVANVANAGAGMLGAAVSPLTEAPGIGPPLKNILGAVPWLANKTVGAGEGVINAGLNAVGGFNPFKGKLTQDQASQAQGAVHDLTSNIATVPLAEGLTRGIASGVGAAIAPFTAEGRQAAADISFKRANPPLKNELNYDDQLQRAKPYLVEQIKKNPVDASSDLSPHEQGLQLATQAKQSVFDKYDPIIKGHPEVQLSGDDVASAVNGKISRYLKDVEPKRAAQIQDYADRYAGKDLSLTQANDYLTGLNAELSDYYKQPATVRAQMDATGVPIAAKAAAADALRGQMIKGLENVGETSVEGLRGDYGAVSQMAEAIRRNVVRADKPQPSMWTRGITGSRPLWIAALGDAAASQAGLPQGIALPAGVATAAFVEHLRSQAQPSAQMLKAMNRYGESTMTPPDVTSTRPMVRGLLPPAQVQLPMGEEGMNSANVERGSLPPQEKTFQYPRPAQGPMLKPPWLRGGGNAEQAEILDANKKLRGE